MSSCAEPAAPGHRRRAQGCGGRNPIRRNETARAAGIRCAGARSTSATGGSGPFMVKRHN